MKILLIEDHPYKRGQIINFFAEHFPDTIIEARGSYISGLRELINNHNAYELLVLDISMPNYDISPEESGGDFIPQAGKLILKEMYLREIPTKAVVVTMYENFVDGTPVNKLDEQLRKEFAENYLGYVHFSANNNLWKEKLIRIIKQDQQ